MLTIVESPLFSKLWPDYWTENERGEFCVFIAARPDAGDLVPDSTARLTAGELVLLTIYAKSVRENIPAHVLRKIAEEMSDAPS